MTSRWALFAATLAAALVGGLTTSSPAAAGLDNEKSLIDSHGRTLTIQQWDTFLNGVPPLDRNRLTREWFHTGKAKYSVTGPGADTFTGTLQLGYQVSFPWTMGVSMNFSYSTPNVGIWWWGEKENHLDKFDDIYTPPFFPGGSISVDLGNGPGLQEVATFSSPVEGPEGKITVSNAHGTVTGVTGGVVLRPFAKLITADGEEVSTFGEPWNMN
ncbi:MspA family porin [Mycolicibacterium diernhoferi]|uniref:Porin n=1 Tax=Mycolicibacterium diernhoferi TaxID=1801 RepID=A0A1Q4H3Q3_9MYCO|nr:MspA family porin [Mycolicibacterium diernhoferi]OJZ60559.1 porin [Mycolicibacterium diernhoferi]OPE44785.1 porin [Mycolicibacterium diernhoferi]PEG51060.1 porin [Mycolicibacterium diernhoferi]QYL23776.1 MspA family porin [Mycolicibacterium diernhoferi]